MDGPQKFPAERRYIRRNPRLRHHKWIVLPIAVCWYAHTCDMIDFGATTSHIFRRHIGTHFVGLHHVVGAAAVLRGLTGRPLAWLRIDPPGMSKKKPLPCTTSSLCMNGTADAVCPPFSFSLSPGFQRVCS
jgi:hypothetical protein